MHAENLSVVAAFDLSYQTCPLAPGGCSAVLAWPPAEHRRLRRRCPGWHELDDARRQLDDLYDQHLISEPAPGRYLLHDLLREYARMLASIDDAADCDAAAGRLLDYYLHAAVVASQRIAPWGTTAACRSPPAG